jgi:hypothetical protein
VKLILRSVVAILAGILISVIVHFAALEYVWNYHAANSRFAAVFFAPGSLLAGRGFEAQSGVVLLNVLAFAVFFSVASFLLLRVRRAFRQKL